MALAVLATKGIALMLGAAFVIAAFVAAIGGDIGKASVYLAGGVLIARHSPQLPPELAEKMQGFEL